MAASSLSLSPGMYHLVHERTNERRRADRRPRARQPGARPAPPRCRRGALHGGRAGRPEPAPHRRGHRDQPPHAPLPLRIQGRPAAGGRPRGGGPDPGAALAALGEDAAGETDELIRRMWSYLADPALGDFERLFFALYGRALQGDDAIRPLLDDDVTHWLDANVALSARSACPPTSPGPTPASGWPSRAASCSTCSPPATVRGSTPPSRCSRRATAAGGGSFRRARAQRPRLVEAAVARGHGEDHGRAHLDAPAPVGDGGGVEAVARPVVVVDRAEAPGGVERGHPPVVGPGGGDGAGHVNGRSWTAGSPKCRSHPGRAAPG